MTMTVLVMKNYTIILIRECDCQCKKSIKIHVDHPVYDVVYSDGSSAGTLPETIYVLGFLKCHGGMG